MRDTFVTILVLLGLAGVYTVSKRFEANVSDASATTIPTVKSNNHTAQSNTQKFTHSTLKTENKQRPHSKSTAIGDPHESTNHRSREQVQRYEQASRPSKPTQQAEKLPSIYQDEGSQNPAAVTTTDYGNSLEADGDAPTAVKTSQILGVSASSWILSQKNRLAEKVEPKAPNGIRVFFNCMELKKEGAKSLENRDCEALALRPDVLPRNSY